MKQVKLESPHLVTFSKGNIKIVIESSQYKKKKEEAGNSTRLQIACFFRKKKCIWIRTVKNINVAGKEK